jgi:hypothetical protein
MLIAPLSIDVSPTLWPISASGVSPVVGMVMPSAPQPMQPRGTSRIECVDDPDEDEEDLGDEEDLAVAQPAADEESSFDDFDDEFDDDFEEEENDPDWDHPDDSAPEAPPPGKGGGRKK